MSLDDARLLNFLLEKDEVDEMVENLVSVLIETAFWDTCKYLISFNKKKDNPFEVLEADSELVDADIGFLYMNLKPKRCYFDMIKEMSPVLKI